MSRMFMPQQTAFSYCRSAHTLISDAEDYKETTFLNLTNLGEGTQVTIQPYLHIHPRAGVFSTNFRSNKLVELGEVYFVLLQYFYVSKNVYGNKAVSETVCHSAIVR